MTTFEPGARLVFTHGFVVRPRATALRASRPAASITDGLDVLVQDVMAATTTSPFFSLYRVPSAVVTGAESAPVANAGSSVRNACLAECSAIRSCGRRGPAIDGTTEPRSSSRYSE